MGTPSFCRASTIPLYTPLNLLRRDLNIRICIFSYCAQTQHTSLRYEAYSASRGALAVALQVETKPKSSLLQSWLRMSMQACCAGASFVSRVIIPPSRAHLHTGTHCRELEMQLSSQGKAGYRATKTESVLRAQVVWWAARLAVYYPLQHSLRYAAFPCYAHNSKSNITCGMAVFGSYILLFWRVSSSIQQILSCLAH